MKKFNKRGFTLVELLVTIVLLGIVATIIIFNMTNVSNQTKESDYEKFVAGVKSAASVYADTNPDVFNDLYVNRAYLYITIKDLVTNGLYDADTINPYTEERVGFDEIIKANLDSSSGQVTFTYPMTEKEEESFLVALSDYIVWGEPYTTDDCWYGAGTYQFALSDEEGNLIDISSESVRKEYSMTCELPADFDKTKDGIYKITYNWLSKSGTKKSAQREIRVMPKVIPTFKTNYEYDFERAETDMNYWYTPKYNNSSKQWETLTFTPYIEQSDENTTFTITKRTLLPTPSSSEVTIANNEKIFKDYAVDDGSKEYTIKTTITGHHHKDYSYPATGSVKMRSKLIIPPTFITGGSSKWATTRTFTVRETYSPVGVVKYEYRLMTSSDSINNASAVNNSNTFNKNSEYTNYPVSLAGIACTNAALMYDSIAFRAINRDGYVGDWTVIDNAYITNQLDLVIRTDCAECTGTSCVSQTNGQCYFTSKAKYVRYGSQLFVILERFSDGSLLVALDGVYDNISPISMLKGEQTVQTCNGTYTARYEYASASLSVIREAAQRFLNLLPRNYNNYISFYNWPYGTAFVGNIDLAMYEKYGRALDSSSPYWTTSTKSESFQSKVPWGAATAWNTYFYYIGGGTSQVGYAGMKAPIKPLLKMRTVYACGGTGTASDPYVIAS